MLVGVQSKRRSGAWRAEDSMAELGELARSAGARVVGSIIQRLDRPTNLYVGKGKLDELSRLAERLNAT